MNTVNLEHTELTFVRHGETGANHRNVLQGQRNTRLTAAGIRQAEAAAEFLSCQKFDVLLSSDLCRAAQTARIIGGKIGLKARLFPELREWNLGTLQGKRAASLSGAERAYLQGMFYNRSETAFGGETYPEVKSRIAGFLDNITREYAGKRILIVSHGGAIQTAFRILMGNLPQGMASPLVSNAATGKFRWWNNHWQLCCWNEAAYTQSTDKSQY